MEYLCDTNRHLICIPFSIPNLHLMAENLGIKRCWYHAGTKHPHYDIPKRRIEEITNKCKVISSRDLLGIIKAAVSLQSQKP